MAVMSSVSSSSTSNPPTVPSESPSISSSAIGGGVVVVGFVGSRPTAGDEATSAVINRIIDANVFGSGDLCKDLSCFGRHRISYHYDALKGTLFLQLSSSSSSSSLSSLSNSDSLEEFESEHLRGLLFMFSVCHVVVFLHEGLRFDTEILKKLRMLQASKHALSPFIRARIAPVSSVPESSPSVSLPQRRTNRPSSSISLMSGTGTRPSALPGQCVPVILFVFYDDFCDGVNSVPAMEDLGEASYPNQSSSTMMKGSGSVVMLARPVSKSEGSFKKKLHGSLDAQIRFLIKKCRVLGTESGSRGIGGGSVNALPLFSLDASRAVALIDRSVTQRGETLDFITSLDEDAFKAKGASETFMLGNQCQALNSEEIQMIKDFIYRQCDILRGRGGLTSNSNSGSVAGVGMVAAAAAAAAASTSFGRSVAAPVLPSFENWLSSSSFLINALLSIEHQITTDESGNIKRPSLQSSAATEMQNKQAFQLGASASEAAVSCLEGSMGLNMKFSDSWCKRALPAAKDVYLKDLPACYPSALHNSQLEKALQAFRSMAKGPSVQMFTKKLEDECYSIWTSGRQLCDAVSLTRKQCMHQRHTVEDRQHSSGYYYLHACACGRSRLLHEDPFDFSSANLFNCSTNCEDSLPSLVLPKRRSSASSLIPPTSWRLLRLGGARYYHPSKGLLQTGFISRENCLLKWTISLDRKKRDGAMSSAAIVDSVVNSTPDLKASAAVDEEKVKIDRIEFTKEVQTGDSKNLRKASLKVSSDDSNISFGKGLPSVTMKKPFSEVVAGTVLADSTFPVLGHNKQQNAAPAKGVKQMRSVDETDGQVHKADDRQESQRTEISEVQDSSQRPETDCQIKYEPFLQVGSYLVPVKTCDSGKVLPNSSRKQVAVYVGFEHECSYGHRFILSPKHLMELDSSYSMESVERKHVETSNVVHEEMNPSSFRTSITVNNSKRSNRSVQTATSKFQSVPGLPISSNTMEELEGDLLHITLDDGDWAFSLLNRNLPLYMNCPHCKRSAKQNPQDIKFASTVSQLQRIFLVTPPFPTVLATSPVIQFEEKCLSPSTPVLDQKLCFTFGCQVILPPESFLTLKLPFVYGVQMGDGSLQPLGHLKHQPELSACLLKGTALQVISMGHDTDDKIHM